MLLSAKWRCGIGTGRDRHVQKRERSVFPIWAHYPWLSRFWLMKSPLLYRSASVRERSGSARKVPYGAPGSEIERAAPSACVGGRFSAPQIVWNRSTRRAGARGGARVGRPRCLRILTITGGFSMAAMIFKAPPQFGQCSMSMSKTRLSSRAQLSAPARQG
jgi:hypothetical protein